MKKNSRIYITLFWEFFKIGIFTIGGGMAMIPQIQQLVVEDKKWLDRDEMLDCIAISQSLPGVIAINSATYIGNRIRGIKGSLAATLGVVMPSFIIIILAVTVLGAIGENRYVLGVFTGIKAAVCGLILVTAVRLAKDSLTSAFQWVLAIAALIAIGFFGVTAIWAIIVGAVVGIIYNSIRAGRNDKMTTAAGSESSGGASRDDESSDGRAGSDESGEAEK